MLDEVCRFFFIESSAPEGVNIFEIRQAPDGIQPGRADRVHVAKTQNTVSQNKMGE